jgi:hypothetical protein
MVNDHSTEQSIPPHQQTTTRAASQENTTVQSTNNTAASCGNGRQQQKRLEMLQPLVFDLVLGNNVLHWHVGILLNETSQECKRLWDQHKHWLLRDQLLATLNKMSGRKRVARDRDRSSSDDDPTQECALLVRYLSTSVRKLHNLFDMRQLDKVSKLRDVIDNVNLQGVDIFQIEFYSRRYPRRVMFAKNLAFLAYAQIQQYRGIDFDFDSNTSNIEDDDDDDDDEGFERYTGSAFFGDDDDGRTFFLQRVYGQPSYFDRQFADLLGEMIPFTNEKLVNFCRKYALSREHCECLGPVLLKKTSILGPLVDYDYAATTTTTHSSCIGGGASSREEAMVHLPPGLEIIPPRRPPPPLHYIDRFRQILAERRRNDGEDDDDDDENDFDESAFMGLIHDFDENASMALLHDRHDDVRQLMDAFHIGDNFHDPDGRIPNKYRLGAVFVAIVLAGLLYLLLSKCIMGLMMLLPNWYSPSSIVAAITFSWPLLCAFLLLFAPVAMVRGRVVSSIVAFCLWWWLYKTVVELMIEFVEAQCLEQKL